MKMNDVRSNFLEWRQGGSRTGGIQEVYKPSDFAKEAALH